MLLIWVSVSGEVEVGYFTTATKLFSILLALYTAFTGVLMPRMSNLIREGCWDEFKILLRKSIDILLFFSIPLIIFSIVFAPEIINMISGKGYEGAIVPMRLSMPLILIIGLEQILIIQTLMPLKEDKIILRNSIFGCFCQFVTQYMYREVIAKCRFHYCVGRFRTNRVGFCTIFPKQTLQNKPTSSANK